MVSAVNPCRTALTRDRRLPSSVFGPVLPSALCRLASIVETVSSGGYRCQRCQQSTRMNFRGINSRPASVLDRAVEDLALEPLVATCVRGRPRVSCQDLSAVGIGSMLTLPTTRARRLGGGAAMVDAAQRHRGTHPIPCGRVPALRESKMVGFAGLPVAHRARLNGDEAKMILIAGAA